MNGWIFWVLRWSRCRHALGTGRMQSRSQSRQGSLHGKQGSRQAVRKRRALIIILLVLLLVGVIPAGLLVYEEQREPISQSLIIAMKANDTSAALAALK